MSPGAVCQTDRLTKGQRVTFLFDLIEWLDLFNQKVRREVVQFVRRLGIAKDHDKGPVEEFGAINFDLVCERVPGELLNVSFQVENVKA